MRRSLTLFVRFAALSVRNGTEFRIDFFTTIAHHLLYQTIFIVFWKSIMDRAVTPLGEWTFPRLALLSALSLVAVAVMQWFVGLLNLPGKVLRGDLDKYLCRPISPILALVAEEVNAVASLHQFISAMLILTFICVYFQVEVTPVAAAGGALLLFTACGVMVLIQACVGLASFWWGEVSRVNAMLTIVREFQRYPVDLFPAWLRHLLVAVVPIGLMSTYPLLVMLQRVDTFLLYEAVALVLLIVWALFFRVLWWRALRRYESCGG